MTEQQNVIVALVVLAAGAAFYAWHRREGDAAGVPVDLSGSDSIAVPTDNSAPFGLSILSEIAADIGVSVPLGASLHNWGNLRYIQPSRAWIGQLDAAVKGFGEYASDELGCRAMGHQIMKLYNLGHTNVESIVSIWAPKTENDTNAYIDKVAQDLSVLWNEPLALPARLGELMYSMIDVEQGYCPFDPSVLQSWGNES